MCRSRRELSQIIFFLPLDKKAISSLDGFLLLAVLVLDLG
jgi:hypothetical protein